ncbi:DUF1707 domain-containing protein [Blastococcus sp. TML/M2B]|uniref:DUF1707 SHOCT-like domain-containing protein n=1 Tax=unclassified Blastococcus TaxID=2619396 RepID=UPI0019095780|nr:MULTISPECIES: DUF1707 domain-containing protein [unclassified Blastococcus]MBN1093300.1 DUF1707 domain-containing protein [Blastococcus sp. TML/M2B]MBN1096587.1 DUF1707 domain-containing protein [Blastococcus sp. TML/C7B]
MTHAPDVRAGDADRQAAADRLRAAHDEGRLDLDEYDRRLAAAYAAVTYGDLARLFTDLPARTASPAPVTSVAAAAGMARAAGASVVRRPAGFPLALKILWTIWASVVALNVTVWLLVSLGTGLTYFWPMWLAVPGVALGVGTVLTMRVRGSR